jgi:hypothetical protein
MTTASLTSNGGHANGNSSQPNNTVSYLPWCLVSLVFVPSLALAIACGPVAVLGAWFWLSKCFVSSIRRGHTVIRMWLVIGPAIPVASGALDLYLRQNTP